MEMAVNKRIVAVTPAGRKSYLEVLAPYIFAKRGVIDEWHLWINTAKEQDVSYCRYLHDLDPTFVRLVPRPEVEPTTRPLPQPPFFRHAIDLDTVYIKFDDDICWVAGDAVEQLWRFRQENPQYFLVMANTVCNGVCAAIHQRNGSMSFLVDGEIVRMDRHWDNKLYRSPRIAEYVHRTFIEDLLSGDVAKYRFPEYPLDNYENFSINCIAWDGADFAEFGGKVKGDDEERWLCTTKTRELGRKNCVCGDALVAHFGFYTHRKPFCGEQAEIDQRILAAYRRLAQEYAGETACQKVWGRSYFPPSHSGAIRSILNVRTMI